MWIFYVSFCPVFVMSLCMSVYMCFVVTCRERSDLLALICGIILCVCHFPIGILGQVWYWIVSIPDLCTLTYYDWSQGKCQNDQKQFIIKTYAELILYKPVGEYQFTMACIRALALIAYQVIKCLISQPKYMLWVLKRTVAMRRFF